MSRSSSQPPADPGFEVDIRRGRRAVDAPAPAPAEARPARLSAVAARPARAQQTQQRVLAGVLIAAVAIVAGAFAFSWWSAQPPAGVLARINGEDIRVDQVDHEILLNRAMTALLSGKEVAPSRSATVEDLLDRRMKRATPPAAGVTVSDADVQNFVLRQAAGPERQDRSRPR